MDKEREDILNDLIQYYDGDKKPEHTDPQDTAAASAAPDTSSMGDTIAVPTAKPAVEPEPDEMGQTRVVKMADSEPLAETRQISKVTDIPDEELLSDKSNESEPITEEILGCLDLSGNHIDPVSASEPVAEKPQQEEEMHRRIREREYDEPEETPRKHGGIWYSLKPLWVTMIACAIAMAAFEFYRTEDGFIGMYKRNFNDNMRVIFDTFGWNWIDYDKLQIVGKAEGSGHILSANSNQTTVVNGYAEKDNTAEQKASSYKRIGDNKTVIPFADADNACFMRSGKGVVCAKSNYACCIGTDGKTRWETETNVSNPVADAAGRYLAVASKGGRQISLYRDDKLQYTIEAENSIRDCKVSAKGDVVLVTDKPSYKGAVVMINKKGEKVFSWSSGVNYITGVQVLNNRSIAVALSNTDERVTSYLMLFDIRSTEPKNGVEMQDTLLYDVSTDGKNICVNGDNYMAMLSSGGDIQYENRFDDVIVTHSANDQSKGTRVLTYNENNLPYLAMYDKKGRSMESYRIENSPDHLSVYGTTVAYNNGRTIICGNIRDEVKTAYRAPLEINKLMLLGNNTYAVIYGDSLEIVRF